MHNLENLMKMKEELKKVKTNVTTNQVITTILESTLETYTLLNALANHIDKEFLRLDGIVKQLVKDENENKGN